MTERIDLNEIDTESDDDEADRPNPGDWLWRGEGDPANEPDADGTTTTDAADPSTQPAPHVPHPDKNKPVGIPTESGGAGTGAGSDEPAGTTRPAGSAADGPHGGGVDDMTMAFTYRAVRRLESPSFVFSSALGWADWIGVVGNVDAPVITKFQRENGIDVDFFNGGGTEPGDRLREIDRNSMFYAERMVVVGDDDSDEAIADAADWEYIPLETAAEKADWELGP